MDWGEGYVIGVVEVDEEDSAYGDACGHSFARGMATDVSLTKYGWSTSATATLCEACLEDIAWFSVGVRQQPGSRFLVLTDLSYIEGFTDENA